MYIIRSHLLGLNKWKEAITGQPHDMTLLSKLTSGVDTRLRHCVGGLVELSLQTSELWDHYSKPWITCHCVVGCVSRG